MKDLFSYFPGGPGAPPKSKNDSASASVPAATTDPTKPSRKQNKPEKSRPATSPGDNTSHLDPSRRVERPSSAPSKRTRKVIRNISDDSDDNEDIDVAFVESKQPPPPSATRKKATPSSKRGLTPKPPSATRISARVADDDTSAQDGQSPGSTRAVKEQSMARPTRKTLFKPEPAQTQPHHQSDFAEQKDPHKKKFNPYKPREPPPQQGSKPRPVGKPNCLKDHVFVITGVLDSLERDECTDLCKEYGARVVSTVSGKTTHVIAGGDPGESKLTKARNLKVPQISEDELFEMINSTAPSTTPAPVVSDVPPMKMEVDQDIDGVHKPKEVQKKKFNPYKPREPPAQRGKKPRPVGKPNCLKECVFVITGVLDSLERDECGDLCKEYGARVVGSVSGKTTHIVVGLDPGESKITKARTLKLPQISEDDLFQMINVTGPPKPSGLDSTRPPSEEVAQKITRQESAANAVAAATVALADIEPAKVFSSKAKTESAPSLTKAPSRLRDISEHLWVDKYKPRSSSELCGNPSLVKELRIWLSEWKYTFLRPPTVDARGKKRKAGSETPKAALLAGPPGIGKTTLARIICSESGFEPHEFNASDTRNKKSVQSIVGSLTVNDAMEKYCLGNDSKKVMAPEGQVVIMDECDGMSGGDRGGIQELIKMIKESKIPIICIVNDDMHMKVRSLANHCLKLKFRRPMASQCRKRLLKIAEAEKMVMDEQTAEKIADSCHGDIRQMVNCMQAWSSTGKSISYQGVVKKMDQEGKSFENQSIFEVYKKFFEPSKYSVADRLDEFFTESDLNPLFVHENYVLSGSVAQNLERLADAADAISDGDLVSGKVRGNQRWDLMPIQALMGCVRAGSLSQGYMTGRVNFPAWLGKNSTTMKSNRLLRELDMRSKLQKSGSLRSFRLDYLDRMYSHVVTPMTQNGVRGIEESIVNMDAYYFSREDFDSIGELILSEPVKMATQLKSAFTRQYNSTDHRQTTGSSVPGGKGKKEKAVDDVGMGNGDDIVVDAEIEGAIEQEDDEEDDEAASSFLKPKKKARVSRDVPKKSGSGKSSKGSKGSRGRKR